MPSPSAFFHVGTLLFELLLAAAAVGGGAVLVQVLLRRNDLDRPGSAQPTGPGHALLVNALGFLLIGTFVAGSGLLVDLLSRVFQLAP
jgi:hypothetical protein